MLSFTQSRTELIPATALPAGSAWLDPDYFDLPKGLTQLTYWITYTRGAANGHPILRPQWYNGGEFADELILDESSFAAAAPEGTVNVYLQRLSGPAPADGSPIVYCLVLKVPYGSTQARLNFKDSDAVNPGTIILAYTGGTGEP